MRSKKPYHKRPKRIGRGHGSGHGKTSTKGHKGQRARAGFSMRPNFEGGQTPLYRRIPKRGFNYPNHKIYAILNVDQLSELDRSDITPEWLIENGVIKELRDGLKILGRGKMSRSLTIHAHKVSQSAKQAIEKAGGRVVLIGQS